MAKAGDRIVKINKLRLESAPPVSVSNVHVMRLPYLEACEVMSRRAVTAYQRTSSVHQLLLLAAAADTTASRRGEGIGGFSPSCWEGQDSYFGSGARAQVVVLGEGAASPLPTS